MLTHTVESFDHVVIPGTLRSIVLHISQHAKLAGHLGGDGSCITPSGGLKIGLRCHSTVTQQFDLSLRVQETR